MDFDRFIDQIKQIRSIPTSFLLDRLTAALHGADAGVHATFFGSQPTATYLSHNATADQPALAELSVRYASYTLEGFPNWGFAQSINGDAWPGIQNWFATSSSTVGLDMFTDFLTQDPVIGTAFADPTGSASEIADRIAAADFLTGLLVECDTFGSDLPAKLTLLVLRILDNAGANFQRAAAVWATNDRWAANIEGYDRIGWLDAIPPDLVRGGPTYTDTYQTVATCCAVQTQYHYTNTTVMGNGGLLHSDALRTTYGAAVGQWLESGSGPKAYGLRSGARLSNVVDQPWGSGGCVIAGTPILLADGTTKPVEAIVEGDRVVSGAGAVSVASAELVVNDRLTTLYSFNDDVPFMSLEHAVMTQRGWCSLAPAITLDFAPHQRVSQLRVGDVVWRECGPSGSGNGLRYEHILVKRINVQEFAAGTAPVGYDLHLRGQASYHAHGYCTLSNYPEITSQRVAANVLSRMSPAEQLRFEGTLVELAPQLSKALGAGVVAQVAAVFGDLRSAAARAAHTDANGQHLRTDIGAAHLVVPRLQVVPRIGSAVAADLKELGVTHGTLCIGGEAVESTTDGQRMYWSRPVAGGRETGVLEFSPHGLRARGAVSYGGATQLFTAVGMVGYTVTTAPNATPWYEFDMGFTRDDQGNQHATGSISDPTHPDGAADLTRYSTVVFSTATSSGLEVLHATVAIDPQYCQFGGSSWVGAEIDFTPDYTQFAGTAYPFDASQPGYRGAGVALTGTCTDLGHLAQMTESATRLMASRPTAIDHLAAAPAAVAATHPLVTAAAPMLAADDPTVEHLFDLPTPDMTNVQRLAFAKMQSLMLLALSKQQPDWLKFMGETAPPVGAGQTLSDADAALLDDSAASKFLVDRFAVGYLTQAFRTSDDAAIKAVFDALAGVDDKLAFFWKGTGTTSFAKDPAYSALSAKMLDSAYTDAATDLQPYLAGDRASWAQQLYDYCTKQPTLTGLAMTNTLDGRQQLTHLATLLHVLDPVARIQKDDGKAISYATSLYERVMDIRLNEVLKFVSVADKDDMVEYLTEFFKQYFASLLTGQWSDNIRAQAAKDLADLMAQYNVDNANALVDQISGIISQAAEIMLNTEGTLPARLQAWAKANPKISGALSTGMSIGVYTYGIYQTVRAYLDWKDLNTQERVAVVANTLQIAANIFNDVAQFAAARTLATATASLDDVMQAAGTIQNAMDLQRLTTACDKIGVQVDVSLGDLAAPGLAGGGGAAGGALAAAEDAADVAAKWMNVAKVTELVARGLTIVALAAGCVATGFEIASDFATDQPAVIKAFDILSEISNGVAFIVEGVVGIAVLAGVEVCSAIPIIGTVAAVIGIIIAFVSMFIHRKPPPTPQEVFVDEQSKPFVTGLAAPDQAWVTAQQAVTKHLGGDGTATLAPALV